MIMILTWAVLVYSYHEKYPTAADCSAEILVIRAFEAFFISMGTSGNAGLPTNDPPDIQAIRFTAIVRVAVERFQTWWEQFDDIEGTDPLDRTPIVPLGESSICQVIKTKKL
jgi:hypothetical protein